MMDGILSEIACRMFEQYRVSDELVIRIFTLGRVSVCIHCVLQ